ncbi:hypothetical protein F2Q70_00031052 [Brassica cretica]|uniref:Uncharacterized protein n=1 Tax=Brassica cretica TaxID=69181 RepID=A0A8S9FCB6_BRACR|nr:hypothetical protein F2Q70_00031052 [Brassica cretica]
MSPTSPQGGSIILEPDAKKASLKESQFAGLKFEIFLSPLDRRVVTPSTRRVLTSTDESSLRPMSPHSTEESSLDRRVLTRPKSRHSTVLSSLGAERSLAVAPFSYSLRIVSIRFKLSIKTSPNPLTSPRLVYSLVC